MKKTFFLSIALFSFLFLSLNSQAQNPTKGKTNTSKPKPKPVKPTVKPAPASNGAAFTLEELKKNPNNVGRTKGSYNIKIKINGFKNVPMYLADNFGDKQYFRDTCFLDANGVGKFTGSPKLQHGMYMIVFPELNGYYELPITDDQDFSFESDTSMDDRRIKITGSIENESFAEYQKIRRLYGETRYKMDQDYKQAKTTGNKEQEQIIKTKMDTLDAQDARYRDNYIAKNPNYFLSKLFTAFKQIKVPDFDEKKDSLFGYKYFKNHYWDNVDFSSDALIRAPQGLLHNKLNEYIDKVIVQDPDSLIVAVDYIIGKTKPLSETNKYFIQSLTNKFQDRKIMCQDNVTIHMINKYYCTGTAWWYNDTAGFRKMCEESKKAVPTMCGKVAPDLNMEDTAGKLHRLYENLGKYTILFFYDPTCGHCKEVIPIVNAVFQKHKGIGLKVYAVSTENKYSEWMEMMRKKPELHEWINVCKTSRYYPWPINKYDYNIVANPTLFVLDQSGKIIGKKIDEHQLEYFIESLFYEDGIIKVKPVPPVEKKKEETQAPAPAPQN